LVSLRCLYSGVAKTTSDRNCPLSNPPVDTPFKVLEGFAFSALFSLGVKAFISSGVA
jgi:hypothetical protein